MKRKAKTSVRESVQETNDTKREREVREKKRVLLQKRREQKFRLGR